MPSQTVSSGPIIGSTGSDWLEGSKAGSATGLREIGPCDNYRVLTLSGKHK